MKGGCLYGSNSSRMAPTKFRGVQVFTYRELEMATDKFGAANVIGNGGYGVVYRGTLSDGTLAAIKMLHREGRQGERAFRLEVSTSPLLLQFFSSLFDEKYFKEKRRKREWGACFSLLFLSLFSHFFFLLKLHSHVKCTHKYIIDEDGVLPFGLNASRNQEKWSNYCFLKHPNGNLFVECFSLGIN